MITTEHSFSPRPEELPENLAVFPLAGALLLPEGRLPLNVFEPRYLALVEDALAEGRLMGMIQPPPEFGADAEPPLSGIGCLGRIVTFAETDDGRYLVTLHGVSRFRVASEIAGRRGYRRVVPDWQPYLGDITEAPALDLDRARLLEVLGPYLQIQHMEFNRKILDSATDRVLLLSLAMSCPFPAREKQALLECADHTTRGRTLIALMELAIAEAQGGAVHLRQ